MLDRVDDIRAILFRLMLRAMRADLGRLFIEHKADLGLGGRCLPLCTPLRAIVQENGVPEWTKERTGSCPSKCPRGRRFAAYIKA
jgi:hypothetical protein